jgi:diacylglycerol kinase
MQQKRKTGVEKRLRRFGFAFSGLCELIRSETNARIHLVAAILAIGAGFILRISLSEWCVIVFAIALVFAAESFNTAIEKLTDHLFPDYHETARIVKDISAGAVLICALAAFVAGLIIFIPKIVVLVCG